MEVLLATYNGERYLTEQLDSILSQRGVDFTVLVSDDGSTDGTPRILSRYQADYPDKIRVLASQGNSGHPKWNFMRLMTASQAPYIALADQDDVWFPEKLLRCMQAMESLAKRHGSQSPLLIFTDMKVVDRDLSPVAESFWTNQGIDPERIHTLPNLLVQNVVAGCTTLMNRPLRNASLSMPPAAAMHDWWIALIASTTGHAEALHEATVLYRQHGSNAVGAVLDHSRRFVPRARFHTLRRAQWEMAAQQAAAFLALFRSELSDAQGHLLEQFVRCEESPNRLVRVSTWLRYRFFQRGLRPNLAMLWYLWDMKAAKQASPSTAREA